MTAEGNLDLKRIVLGMLGIIALFVAAIGLPAAYAQVTKSVSGTGTGGALCSGGGPFPASIVFSATSAQGTTSGTYTMVYTTFPTTLPTTGIITGGHINHHNYKLDGLRVFDNCTPTTNVPISFEGACGTAVTITYELHLGSGARSTIVAGTFTGDVTCTTA